nr:hypothetical protein [Planococcus glaciei]
MANLILAFFLVVLISLNVLFFSLSKKRKTRFDGFRFDLNNAFPFSELYNESFVSFLL